MIYEDEPDELTGGEWRVVRGVQRWFPALASVPDMPREFIPAKSLPELTELIACPTCHAKVRQSCKSISGNPRDPHTNRLAPRLCPCGSVLAPKKSLCEKCRIKARRRTYKRREMRRPTAARRRQKEAA